MPLRHSQTIRATRPVIDGPTGHGFFDNMYFPGAASSPANVNDFRMLGYEYEPVIPTPSPPSPTVAAAAAPAVRFVPQDVVSPYQ